MTSNVLRWGVLGTAGIATKNLCSIAEASNAVCVAVASRDKVRAEKFAAENGDIPTAYGSYDELLNDTSIDVVYIPLPTGVRKEWVLKAAEKGKHVLCEKPCGCSTHDLKEMIEALHSRNLVFMDGVMFMHHHRLVKAREALDNGDVGPKPTRVISAFSFPADAAFFTSNIRAEASTEPMGCLGDLGWYCIRISLWAFDYEDPVEVAMMVHRTVNDVPLDVTVEIAGSKASMTMSDFVIPEEKGKATFTVQTMVPTDKAIAFPVSLRKVHTFDGEECVQHTRMIEQFGNIVQMADGDDKTQQIKFFADVATQTQRVCDALMLSGSKNGQFVSMTSV